MWRRDTQSRIERVSCERQWSSLENIIAFLDQLASLNIWPLIDRSLTFFCRVSRTLSIILKLSKLVYLFRQLKRRWVTIVKSINFVCAFFIKILWNRKAHLIRLNISSLSSYQSYCCTSIYRYYIYQYNSSLLFLNIHVQKNNWYLQINYVLIIELKM